MDNLRIRLDKSRIIWITVDENKIGLLFEFATTWVYGFASLKSGVWLTDEEDKIGLIFQFANSRISGFTKTRFKFIF